MNLNLSKFKKVHEDHESATLQHEAGHTIKIAKSALSSHMHKRLGELRFAEGGVVHQAPQQDPQKARELAKGINDGGPSFDEMRTNLMNAFGMNKKAEGGWSQELDIKPLMDKKHQQEDANLQEKYPNVDQDSQPPVRNMPLFEVGAKAKKYADGGEVEQDPSAIAGTLVNTPSPMMLQQQPQMEAAPSNMPVQAPAPAPQAPQANPMAAVQPAMNQQIKGINEQAAAQSQLGQEQTKLAQQQESRMADLQRVHQENYAKLESERAMLQKDINDGHIDPQRFMHSKSGGERAMIAIGLLLGGIGQGMAHLSSNPAMDALNKQIDGDVDAQKAEMNKKQNLLTANMHQFGNLREATMMTRMMVADSYINKLEQAKAKATTPMAKANADMAIGQLKAQYAPLQAQLAMSQTVKHGVQTGAVSPEQAVQTLVPKEHQSAVYKELGNAQNAAQNEAVMLNAFDKASTENTALKTGFGFLRKPASVIEMENMFLPLIHDAEGRVNEFEFNTTKAMMPQPGDTDEKIAAKRQALINFIQQKKAAPIAKGYGIPVPDSNAALARPNPHAKGR